MGKSGKKPTSPPPVPPGQLIKEKYMDYSASTNTVRELLDEGAAVISLFGGLGNQLFQYSFGQFLSETHGVEVRYAEFQRNQKKSRDIPRLSPLIHTGLPGSIFQLSSPPKMPRRFRPFFRMHPALRTFEQSWSLEVRHQKGLGYDPEIPAQVAGMVYSGYWQSWKYCRAPRGELRFKAEDLLAAPSKWFQETSLELQERQPLMLHVRRGDYVGSHFGAIRPESFVEGIAALSPKGLSEPLWIFSDDPEAAREIAKAMPGARAIIPPTASQPVESLVLMARGAGNIISNSTFSWWAAFLNEGSERKARPSPWFRNELEPRDLIPPAWLEYRATFLDS